MQKVGGSIAEPATALQARALLSAAQSEASIGLGVGPCFRYQLRTSGDGTQQSIARGQGAPTQWLRLDLPSALRPSAEGDCALKIRSCEMRGHQHAAEA